MCAAATHPAFVNATGTAICAFSECEVAGAQTEALCPSFCPSPQNRVRSVSGFSWPRLLRCAGRGAECRPQCISLSADRTWNVCTENPREFFLGNRHFKVVDCTQLHGIQVILHI